MSASDDFYLMFSLGYIHTMGKPLDKAMEVLLKQYLTKNDYDAIVNDEKANYEQSLHKVIVYNYYPKVPSSKPCKEINPYLYDAFKKIYLMETDNVILDVDDYYIYTEEDVVYWLDTQWPELYNEQKVA